MQPFGSRLAWRLGMASALILAAGLARAQVDVYSVSYDGPDGDSAPDYPSADLDTDNDFTRIRDAIAAATTGQTITLYGDFDWAETEANADYYANPTGVTIGYTWNQANLLGTRPAANVANVLLQGEPGVGATVTAPKDNRSGVPDQALLAIGGQRNDGWTVQNLTLDNFERAIAFGDTGKALNWTIRDNTFFIGSYGAGFVAAIHVRNYSDSNLYIDGNNFMFKVNAGNYDPGSGNYDGLNALIQGIRVDCCNTNQFKNATIVNNLFKAMWEDKDNSGTIEADERIVTNGILAIDDNNSQTAGTFTVQNNTFDGGVDDGHGGTISAGIEAFRPSQRPDDYTTGLGNSRTVYDGNTFKNFLVCFYPRTFNPATPAQTLIITNTAFENCGYNDPNNPLVLYVLPDKWGTTNEVTYAAAILNARGSAYSGSGGSDVVFDLNTSWNGVTGIPMLNAIANDGRAFESIPLDNGTNATAQAGILAARVEPVAATTYNNSAWTYADRFARPTPEQDGGGTDLSGTELAFGYNAFGDAISEGDPNDLIVNADPTTDGDGDNGLLTIYITADTEIAPGTIVDKPTHILPGPVVKNGAPDGTYKITSTVKKLSSSLFIVQPGGSLTIDDLILDGDTPFSGPRDIRSAIECADNAGQVTLNNVDCRNFYGEVIAPGAAAQVAVNNAIIEKSGNIVKTPVGKVVTNVSFTGCFFQDIYDIGVVTVSGGAVSFSRNVFQSIAGPSFYITGSPSNLSLGSMDNGNLFFDNLTFEFNGAPPAPATYAFGYNWHSLVYGDDAHESNGLVTGDIDLTSRGSGVSVVAGQRTYDDFAGSNYIESSIVARFDRDLDALPDAWELSSDNYTMFDSDNDGWPDGVEVAKGTDPRNGSDFPGGSFVIDEDLDNNGIADWYEQSLAINLGVDQFLGDILRNGDVGLTDAVRSLQIVNGSLPKDGRAGDMNALDVTGLGPNSLANPLQILRYQAGVRNLLPALPGIN